MLCQGLRSRVCCNGLLLLLRQAHHQVPVSIHVVHPAHTDRRKDRQTHQAAGAGVALGNCGGCRLLLHSISKCPRCHPNQLEPTHQTNIICRMPLSHRVCAGPRLSLHCPQQHRCCQSNAKTPQSNPLQSKIKTLQSKPYLLVVGQNLAWRTQAAGKAAASRL